MVFNVDPPLLAYITNPNELRTMHAVSPIFVASDSASCLGGGVGERAIIVGFRGLRGVVEMNENIRD